MSTQKSICQKVAEIALARNKSQKLKQLSEKQDEREAVDWSPTGARRRCKRQDRNQGCVSKTGHKLTRCQMTLFSFQEENIVKRMAALTFH